MIDDENEGTEPCGHADRLAHGFSSAISRIPLPFLGLAAYRAWLNVAFSKDIFGTGPAFFFSQNAFDLTLAVSMLACVLLARWLTPLHVHVWPRIACAGFLVFATLLGFIPLWGPSSGWLLLASTVVGGIGTTLAILLWGELYGRLTPVRACLYYSASLVVAAGLSWMYEGFKIDWLPIMVPLLPLVSMAFLSQCYALVPVVGSRESSWVRFSFPWKPVLVIAVYSFVYGLMQSTFSSYMRPVMSLGTAACALTIVVAIAALGRWVSFEGLYGTVLPLMAAMFLLLATSGDLSIEGRNFCANWGRTSADVLITVMLASICYHWDVSAAWLFGIYEVVTTPAQLLGRVVDGMLIQAGIGVAPLLVVALMFATLVFIRECRLSASWGIQVILDQPASERARVVEERARLVRACSELASSHGLSQREEEVLLLLSQHKSASEIGSELCVAHGTAKAHIRHVYQKLDIHSRDELFGLVGVDDAGEWGGAAPTV